MSRALLDPWRRSLVLAGALVVAGVVALAAAWLGASRTLLVDEQVAFATSGGAGGLALVGSGLGIALVQTSRRRAAIERRQLGVLAADLTAIAERIAERHALAREDTPPRSRPRRRTALRAPGRSVKARDR